MRPAYRSLVQPHQERHLEQFAGINPGDLVPPRQPTWAERWRTAYNYHYDIRSRERFDCARRVD